MSVVIRLSKVGRSEERKFRVVVKEKRSKRQGRPIEVIGYVEEKGDSPIRSIDKKKLNEWIAKGAQLSPGLRKIL